MRQQIDCEEVNPILSAALHLLQVYLHQHLQGLLPHRALPYQTVAVQLSPQPRSHRALPAAVLPAGQQAAAAVVSSSLPLSSGHLLQQLHQEFPPLFQLGWFLPFVHLFCTLRIMSLIIPSPSVKCWSYETVDNNWWALLTMSNSIIKHVLPVNAVTSRYVSRYSWVVLRPVPLQDRVTLYLLVTWSSLVEEVLLGVW